MINRRRVLGVASVIVMATPSYAHAFGANRDCNFLSSVSFRFSSTFPTDRRNAARAGLTAWNTLLDWQGNQDVNAYETTGVSDLIVYPDIDLNGNRGVIDCTTGVMQLNTGTLNDTGLAETASHEMGHVWGLTHVGNDAELDSVGGSQTPTPIMSICQSQGSRAIGNDDQAGLNHKVGPAFSDGVPSLTSEVGFERTPPTAWYAIPSTVAMQSSSTVLSGQYAMAFFPPSATQELTQYVNVNTLYTHRVDLVSSVKRNDSLATTGNVLLELFGQTLTYPSGTGCAGNYVGNLDFDDPTPGGLTMVTSTSCTNSTSWVSCGTPIWDPNDAQHGYNFKIRVRSSVRRSDGTFATVYLDNLRMRDRSPA